MIRTDLPALWSSRSYGVCVLVFPLCHLAVSLEWTIVVAVHGSCFCSLPCLALFSPLPTAPAGPVGSAVELSRGALRQRGMESEQQAAHHHNTALTDTDPSCNDSESCCDTANPREPSPPHLSDLR